MTLNLADIAWLVNSKQQTANSRHKLARTVQYLKDCLLSPVYCLLFTVCCLRPTVYQFLLPLLRLACGLCLQALQPGTNIAIANIDAVDVCKRRHGVVQVAHLFVSSA